jgi:AraC-like DNA-binding protein
VRFQRLIHDASAHRLEEGPGHASFRLALAPGYALPLCVWDYLAATVVLRFRRTAARPADPVAVHLPRPPFPDEDLSRAIFRCEVGYGHTHAEVRWPRAFLDSPMTTGDPTLHALLTRELERALGLPAGEDRVLPRAEPDVVALVRRELRTALPQGDAELAKVARALRVSPRSLQRRLGQRGTTFQALVDDARRALAEELLARRGATVTEAAFTTGFSDVAAFTRAFRRWTGLPPGEWARSH